MSEALDEEREAARMVRAAERTVEKAARLAVGPHAAGSLAGSLSSLRAALAALDEARANLAAKEGAR